MSADAVSGVSGEADPQGTNAAPAFQRDEYKEASGSRRKIVKPWRRRRDRWGKLVRSARCEACGRLLWVNWTRARPCLWCDDSAASLPPRREANDER
jgi:hypothetical protein